MIRVEAAPTITASLSTLETGTTSFDAGTCIPGGTTFTPGKDVCAGDKVVRTNDDVKYSWNININGESATNVIVTHTLPNEMIWEDPNLPLFCGAGSSISANRKTYTCKLGNFAAGSTLSFPIVANLKGDTLNATIVSTSFSVTTTEVQTPVSSDTQNFVVSASPKYDVISQFDTSRKLGNASLGGYNGYPVAALGPNGEPGVVFAGNVGIKISEGGKGSEIVQQPLTMNIDVNYTTPNVSGNFEGARLYTWGANPACDSGGSSSSITLYFPNGNGGGTNGVTNSGTINCSQATPGSPIGVSISGADLSGTHKPSIGFGMF